VEKKIAFSAPGRVCLAGEDIDWISGPSFLSAVELRTFVQIERLSLDIQKVIFSSGDPLHFVHEIALEKIGSYTGHKSDYLNAALNVIKNFGVKIPPVQLNVKSDIPANAGLSSSAAVLVATIAALSQFFGIKVSVSEICNLAYVAESGELRTGVGQMDLYSCGLGGLMYLDSSTNPPSSIEKYDFPTELRIVVVDTLSPRNTGNVISMKRERLNKADPLILSYIKYTEDAIQELRCVLKSSRDMKDIGRIISDCHSYLRNYMQVSTVLLDECVSRCVRNGAYGAKLTGTGMGGCMFALVDQTYVDNVIESLSGLPVQIYNTIPTDIGLRNDSLGLTQNKQLHTIYGIVERL